MTPSTQPGQDEPLLHGQVLLPAISRAMTRCECTGITFSEVTGRIACGSSLDAVLAQTGVGGMCTACLPDLRSYLSRAFPATD
ncbi:MAG: (2Fe-2S)-binding protein [Thermoanaerobaculia bacterium]